MIALSTIFEIMSANAAEKYFLSCLAALPGPAVLTNLFGPALLKQPARWSAVIENSVFVRGLGRSGGDDESAQLRQLAGFLRLAQPAQLFRLVEAGLRLFVDPAVVEAASPGELLQLCRSLCACVAVLAGPVRQQLRSTVLPLIMRGSLIWLDSGPFRRDLG
jgi:hypothetical protein